MKTIYRYRVKNKHCARLNRMARAVNYVWCYCNDAQKHSLKWKNKFLSGFDLNKLTSGSSKILDLHSGTINAICEQYAKSRNQRKKPFLKYRGKKSLGWIPFKGRDIKTTKNGFCFYSIDYSVFLSRPIPDGAKICDGSSFSQDAKGNWYLNVCLDIPEAAVRPVQKAVGIDLGLKDFATLSTGEVIEAQKVYRALEPKLAIAQRARKKRQVKNIHAKIANRRKDFQHKLSNRLVQEFDYIAVGNVNAAGLAKTRMAKSVLDASWSSFRNMLRYKSIRNGATFEEVNERFTTQVCSECGVLSGPKGIADLGIRDWTCECGAIHDRDHNSAKNILRSGYGTPAEGIRAA